MRGPKRNEDSDKVKSTERKIMREKEREKGLGGEMEAG